MKRPLAVSGLVYLTVLTVVFYFRTPAVMLAVTAAATVMVCAVLVLRHFKPLPVAALVTAGVSALLAVLSIFLYQNFTVQPLLDRYTGRAVRVEGYLGDLVTENKRGNERLCLRPHLTGGSVRYLLEHGAPARFVYPGRVYRNETTDARHERAFFQYEALIVDKDISFSSGRVMIETILEKVFGRKVNVRMREGFFPFTEPGYEIDMECLLCGGKGCKACNQAGWIEVMPGGVIHPNVLRAANLDPDVWTGFYTNIGLDRLVMMRYGVDDVRLFHSADLRFLDQFC